MKYLVVGTGGVGGSITGFLALAGKDVTCIARGEHLDAIRGKGLRLISGLKGRHTLPVKAFTAETYNDKADVIIVSIKGYSINESIITLIQKAAHENTIVIPVLNVFGTGTRLQTQLPGITVLDGCIYIVGFVSAPGEITQMGSIFRIVYGVPTGTKVPSGIIEAVQKDLTESGIKAEVSDDIQRDTFIKWSFISAMACTGAYYDVPMGEVQKAGPIRETFTGLSRESEAVGKELGITFPGNLVEYNLKVVDKLDPQSTASMQKDMARGHESEIQGLLFDMIDLASRLRVAIPTYRKVAEKFSH